MRTALALLCLAAPALGAQQVREMSVARPHRGEQRLTAAVPFHGGRLTLASAPAGALYRMESRWAVARSEPVSLYDRMTGRLTLGLRPLTEGPIRLPSARDPELATIALSSRVTLGLALDLTGADGDIDLGGLRLSQFSLTARGSRTRVRLSRAVGGDCPRATIRLDGGELTLTDLLRLPCRALDIDGGVGKVTLEFTGPGRQSMTADVRMTLGELTLRFPRGLGVQITLDRFLARFAPRGFTREGDRFTSEGFAQASSRVELRLASTVGRIRVEWI